MLQFFRSALLRHTIGLFLISLFALKMIGTVTAIVKEKYFSSFKICTDSEKSEKEEKKDPEKQQKTFEFFAKNEESNARVVELSSENSGNSHDFAYCIPHFASVPSPPPDLAC
ncbi:hypothetical protein RYH73_18510 [Olivibacter sp. CPCC 100613]|uniref:hypothetical protein n=1 Tax=Olivibacter sp. CPCC 100613 TaxID=3079931 RepID=UPI002FF92614